MRFYFMRMQSSLSHRFFMTLMSRVWAGKLVLVPFHFWSNIILPEVLLLVKVAEGQIDAQRGEGNSIFFAQCYKICNRTMYQMNVFTRKGMVFFPPLCTWITEHCYPRSLFRRTDLSSFLAAFPLEWCSLLFLTRLHRRLGGTNRSGLVSLGTFQNIESKCILSLSPDAFEPELSRWEELQERHELLLDKPLQSAAAWSRTFCCDTRRRKAVQEVQLMKYSTKSSNSGEIMWNFSKGTHSLFAPGTTNGHNLFTVKCKLLLKALHG